MHEFSPTARQSQLYMSGLLVK